MKVYSVRECSSLVAGALQKDYIFKNITISGTVSNLHFHFSGVIFFSLIDEESRITCRIGKMRSAFLGRRIKNGTEILIQRMGCKIKTIQTDNGREFCNDADMSKSLFQIALKKLGINHKRTRPYSPWQNGVVERSHRVDNEIFYARRRFSSEEEMYKSFKRYATRTNNICRKILKFKSPNEVLKEYQSRVA